jgi:hypothetical protein
LWQVYRRLMHELPQAFPLRHTLQHCALGVQLASAAPALTDDECAGTAIAPIAMTAKKLRIVCIVHLRLTAKIPLPPASVRRPRTEWLRM